MEKKQWLSAGGTYSYREIPDIFETLPPAIYELDFDAFMKQFVLKRVGDDFELPPKIYDLEHDLIDRIMTSFKKLNKNFGVLLKGLKGTGKTIVAKIVCNRLKLPVILVTKPWKDIGGFINSIEQDLILVFDEFEKMYEFSAYAPEPGEEEESLQSVSNLLTLMDGVFTTKYKRLFLFTTNKAYPPDAMMARPSRVRYVKDFADISLEGIKEILEDTVINKDLVPELMNLLKQLEIITVDIVKAIAEEANIYNTADPEFFEIFNVKKQENHYDFFKIEGDKEIVLAENQMYPDPWAYIRKGRDLWLNNNEEYVGRVTSVDKEKYLVNLLQHMDDEGNNLKTPKKITITFRKSKASHYSFWD